MHPMLSDDLRITQEVIDAIDANVAVLNEAGRIVLVNTAWRRFAAANDARDRSAYLGASYVSVWEGAGKSGQSPSLQKLAQFRGFLDGDCEEISFEYPCHSPTQRRWFNVNFARIRGVEGCYALVLHQDITRWRTLEEHTAAKEALVRKSGGSDRTPLAAGEIATLYRACGAVQERAIILPLLQTGLRPGELERVKRAHIDFGAGTLTIQEGGEKRTVILPPSALQAFSDYLRNTDSYPSRRQIERIVRAAGARAGLSRRVTPLTLRHTFESCLLQCGIDSSVVSGLLYGNANLPSDAPVDRIRRCLERFLRD